MIVKVNLNIQTSVSSTINIEGALFEIDMNIKRQSEIDLIR